MGSGSAKSRDHLVGSGTVPSRPRWGQVGVIGKYGKPRGLAIHEALASIAAQTFGVLPDIMTLAKALTNGAVPMGAVIVSNGIYERIVSASPEDAIEFFHGYTYSAHPLACAAGLATQRIYREEGIFERAARLAPYFQERVFTLGELPIVTDVRGFGLLAGIDLAATSVPGERGSAVLRRLFGAGLVVRVTADTVILAPALVAEREHVDRICDTLRQALQGL